MRARNVLICVFFVGLAGCGSIDGFEPPIVDMRGVDQQRYADDLADCRQRKADQGFVSFGTVISNCMEQKGYRVIGRRG